MNVILVTTADNSSGGSRQALYLAHGLHSLGHAVRFFTPPKSALRKLDTYLAAQDLWRDMPNGWRAAEKALRAEIESMTTCGASGSDSARGVSPVIVHAFHNRAVKMAAAFGTLWALKRLPVACCAHRGVIYPPHNPLPYLLPGIKAFIVNSQACANTLPLYWRKKRAHVVHNSIPPERLQPERTPADLFDMLDFKQDLTLPIIGCVAGNNPNKGVSVLLQAFAKNGLAHKARLVVVGVTPDNFLPLCRELSIEDNVRLIGRTENVADYLQIFSLFVIPSFSESQPNTLLEAMSMGLPAIGSHVGGIPEVLADTPEMGEQILFTPGDSTALAAKMAWMLESLTLRKELAARNQAYSLHFKPDYRLMRITKIYEQVLQDIS